MSQPRGKQMIFAPLTMAQIQVLRDEGQLNQVQAFAATAELMAALNYDSTMLQDAEYAALSYASVQYLLRPEPVRQRSVLAAEVDSDSVSSATVICNELDEAASAVSGLPGVGLSRITADAVYDAGTLTTYRVASPIAKPTETNITPKLYRIKLITGGRDRNRSMRSTSGPPHKVWHRKFVPPGQ